MLNQAEKEYCRALLSLKDKDYAAASDHFHRAAQQFATDREFSLLKETTDLLLVVRQQRVQLDAEDKIEVEEVIPYGQEDELR